jgi:hypothetical protein
MYIGQLTSDEFMIVLGKFDSSFAVFLGKLSNADIGVLTAEADTDDGVYIYIFVYVYNGVYI